MCIARHCSSTRQHPIVFEPEIPMKAVLQVSSKPLHKKNPKCPRKRPRSRPKEITLEKPVLATAARPGVRMGLYAIDLEEENTHRQSIFAICALCGRRYLVCPLN